MVAITPKCDMLIDQNKRIGSDPIGHCCFNDATLSNGEYYMCGECAESLKKGDGRITIPAYGSVRMFQQFIMALACHANTTR